MYSLDFTPQFRRDAIACRKKGKNMQLLRDVVNILIHEGSLPNYYKPHLLRDNYVGLWECHIEDDWLLVWKQNDKKLTLLLTNTGSHDYLFG